jgi:hypothetical protein
LPEVRVADLITVLYGVNKTPRFVTELLILNGIVYILCIEGESLLRFLTLTLVTLLNPPILDILLLVTQVPSASSQVLAGNPEMLAYSIVALAKST